MLLTDGYTAPLKLYSDLYRISSSQGFGSENIRKDGAPSLICTGGEWYRFPSSYHLPKNASLAFLKSSFDGQLPQPFTQFGSKQESLALQGGFNDLNEEDVARYVDISDCAFAIEIVGEGDEAVSEVMKYMIEDEHDWKLVAQHDFLDADKTSSLHRILYLPMIRKAAYKKYSLFQRV
jgi:alpha-1,2-mannosyltransferase